MHLILPGILGTIWIASSLAFLVQTDSAKRFRTDLRPGEDASFGRSPFAVVNILAPSNYSEPGRHAYRRLIGIFVVMLASGLLCMGAVVGIASGAI
jgi:hypothetical protein